MPEAPDCLPILVGITGKRSFSPNRERDDALAALVRGRLLAVFRALGARFPGTPKVLLTGGAAGADLLAAEAALDAGREWSVEIVLPFDADLFRADFRLPDGGWHRDTAVFDRLLTQARVAVHTLPPLRDSSGAATPRARLDKDGPQHDAAVRRAHYEQVGQFIAETAMLLVAVMPHGEAPDAAATGGTARVVACRRNGMPDEAGRDVARRSLVLRQEWSELAAPPWAHAWLIDPAATPFDLRLPVQVLPPHTGHPPRPLPYADRIWNLWDDARHWLAGPPARAKQKRPRRRDLRHSLRQAAFAHRLARDRIRTRAPPVPDLPADPLRPWRARQRPALQKVDRWSDSAFRAVAVLFFVAVTSLEVYAKFFSTSRLALGFYVAPMLLGVALVLAARWMGLQPWSEDLRAMTEMLRVRRAWWFAGIGARVDRIHLQGLDADLAASRDAVRALLGWLALRQPSPLPVDWNKVRAVASGPADRPGSAAALRRRGMAAPSDWVGEQLQYFARRSEQREEEAGRRGALTWLLFAASLGLAVLLLLWLPDGAVAHWFHDAAHGLALFGVQGSGGLVCIFVVLLVGKARLAIEGELLDGLRLPATMAAAAVVAVFAGIAVKAAGEPVAQLLGWQDHGDVARAAKYLAVVFFVSATAAAGANQFQAEKAALEAEALAYREARDRFQRAESALAALADPLTGAPKDMAAARLLVEALGRLALGENEAWLKTRRERPLSPVLG